MATQKKAEKAIGNGGFILNGHICEPGQDTTEKLTSKQEASLVSKGYKVSTGYDGSRKITRIKRV